MFFLSAILNLAERERGFSFISSSVAIIGFFVNIRNKDKFLNPCFTILSSKL
jgi:hypothetical protein